MYFSKIVKKCNTGSTVYNSIDFPNGVRSVSPPFVFNHFLPQNLFLVESIVKISYSYIDIHDDVHL